MADVVVVGSFVQDLAFRTEHFPAPGETRIGRFQTGPGGKGFNQAVACRRLGVETKFIGAVGDDLFGSGARAFAEREGIDSAFAEIPSEPSGAASIVIDERARNAIVVALGANNALDPEFVEEELREAESGRILIAQLECHLGATGRALAAGRELGFVTILNPAPINPGVTREILASADVLVPNETEFSFLLSHCFGRSAPNPEKMPDAELHDLCETFAVATVVITLGEQGCFVSHREREPLAPWARSDGRHFYRVPAIKVDAVDSTGAGDAFTGGLGAGMILFPGEFARAVRFANVTAGLSVRRPGTAPSMPSRAEVDQVFLELED